MLLAQLCVLLSSACVCCLHNGRVQTSAQPGSVWPIIAPDPRWIPPSCPTFKPSPRFNDCECPSTCLPSSCSSATEQNRAHRFLAKVSLLPPLLVALSGIDPDPERSPVLRSIRFQVWDGERGRFQNTYSSMGGGMFKEKMAFNRTT